VKDISDITGTVPIRSEGDIVLVRKEVREISKDAGFSATDITRIVTAASELARNIFKYAKGGDVKYYSQIRGMEKGLTLEFIDQGPGIEDIDKAMEVGFTTDKGLGMGLPGAKRLMDEMSIESSPGNGTLVKITKWL